MARAFNSSERVALFLIADGKCQSCGTELGPGWHADHVIPWSAGGPTDVTNGQALCRPCNLRKGNRMTIVGPWPDAIELRKWQENAIHKFNQTSPEDFLEVATPAAGKTRFALKLAHQLLSVGRISRIYIVTPSDPLKTQWMEAAAEIGLDIKADWENSVGTFPPDFHGVCVTFHQVHSQPQLHRLHCGNAPTLVIFDEVHHAGDESAWGQALRIAFEPAVHRLSLSGTPFRGDNQRIPFVQYDNGWCVPNHKYTHGEAINDNVCRPVFFPRYGGQMEWESGGTRRTASFEDELESREESERLRTALDLHADHLPQMLKQANERLLELRREDPNAAGLVLANRRQEHARKIATHMQRYLGVSPVVVVSEDPDAAGKIRDFEKSHDPWIVAVNMVSEGVDIPRLRVGVWATAVTAPLFFRQAVGRLVRWENGSDNSAYMYIPDDPRLRELAESVMKERLHALVEAAQEESGSQQGGSGQGSLNLFIPISAKPEFAGITTHEGESIDANEFEQARMVAAQVGWTSTDDHIKAVKFIRLLATAPTVHQHASSPPSEPKQVRVKNLKDRQNQIVQSIAYVLDVPGDYQEKCAHINGALNQSVGIGTVKHATEEQLKKRLENAVQWLTELRRG